jgi:hypothetical protein
MSDEIRVAAGSEASSHGRSVRVAATGDDALEDDINNLVIQYCREMFRDFKRNSIRLEA